MPATNKLQGVETIEIFYSKKIPINGDYNNYTNHKS